MKRKLWAIILSLVCIFVLAFCLTACKDNTDGDDGDDGGTVVKVEGTYYYCENDVLDGTMYITFKDGKWTDDEDQSGEYTLSGADITMFIKIGNEKTEFARGTVSGDDITLDIGGADWVYRKGEDIGTKPKEKTLSYELSQDKSYYIVKGIGGLEGDVTVPDEYKKKPVTEITENAFANCNDLTGIEIGANVTTIGKKAFYKCANLTSVTLGEKVEAIEESTFEECRKLESITIPASVKSIAKKAFYFCLGLKDVHYTGTASDWAEIDFYFYIGYNNSLEICNPICDNNIYIVGNNTAYATHQSRNLYIDGELLTNAQITQAETVSPFAFYGYEALESATLGGYLKEIGKYAFFRCGLENLQFSGSKLTKIDECAFMSCENLQSVSLPSSLIRLEQRAFDSCYSLKTANVGGVSYIGYGAFMGSNKLSSLTLGNYVAEICEAAFYNCEGLTGVTIPSSVIFIGKNAFWGTSLTSAIFKNKNNWIVNKDVPLDSEQLDDPSNAAKILTSSILMQGYGDTDWERQTLKYTLSADGTYYTVTNSGYGCRSEIVIPAVYEGKPVRALGNSAFENCKSLVSITIPDSVTTIGNFAFYGCSSLASITMSGGVASIGNYAFSGCASLTSIKIPSSVTSIGEEAFTGCHGLKSIYYLGDIASWCGIKSLLYLMDSDRTLYINGKELTGEIVIPDGVTSIPNSAFNGCSGITSVIIPNSVTNISNYAFRKCSSLASVTLGDNVATIGSYAFSYCSITSITLPSSLTQVGDYAFNCSGLNCVYYLGDILDWLSLNGHRNILEITGTLYIDGKEVKGELVIPNGVTEIPSYAFNNCSGITGVVLPEGVTTINYNAFDSCVNLSSITIPRSVTTVGSGIFHGCDNLKSVYYMGDVASWCGMSGHMYILDSGRTLYMGGKELKGELEIPNGVFAIPDYAFAYCANITSVTISDSVESIGRYAFDNCKSLVSITIGNSLAKVGDSAFSDCSSLTSVVFPDSLTRIGDSLFYECRNLVSVRLPDGLTNIGRYTFSFCESLKNITLPSDITKIESNTFSYCRSLTSIVIPNKVTSIGEYAFRDCQSLTSATLSNSLITIYRGAFFDCRSLTEITLPASVTTLDQEAFHGCASLKSIVIPDGVTTIENSLLSSCYNLTSIVIPASVTLIRWQPFWNCKNLTSITFKGTKAQWEDIEKENEWDYDTGNYTVHCTDGDIKKG